jgi:hypothetical protein
MLLGQHASPMGGSGVTHNYQRDAGLGVPGIDA